MECLKESCLLSSATTEAELKTGAVLLLQLRGAFDVRQSEIKG